MRAMPAYPSYLAYLLAQREMKQADLVRLLGSYKQQVHKLYWGQRQMSPQWARKIAPHLGVAWPELVDGKPPEEGATAIKEGIVVGESAPLLGDRIYDPDELALLALFRKLSRTKRAALFAYLGAEDMPSLRKAV